MEDNVAVGVGVGRRYVPSYTKCKNEGTIDPITNHPLKEIALDCLKERDVERPSAQQLCERVAALKEGPQYSENVRVVEARSTAEQDRSNERDRELRSQRYQHSQQVQAFNHHKQVNWQRRIKLSQGKSKI